MAQFFEKYTLAPFVTFILWREIATAYFNASTLPQPLPINSYMHSRLCEKQASCLPNATAGKAPHYSSSISREEFPRRRSWCLISRLKLVRKMRLPYRFFVAQAPTRSSAFSMFSIELATLKRK